jgi:hypothetical protein
MPLESEAHELLPTACEAHMQGADRWIFAMAGGILSLPEPFEDSFQPLALAQLGCSPAPALFDYPYDSQA